MDENVFKLVQFKSTYVAEAQKCVRSQQKSKTPAQGASFLAKMAKEKKTIM